MSGLIQGKTTAKNIAVKRFGYLLSALFLVASVVAIIAESVSFPLLFLLTMYFLSASLWLPALIRPLYNLLGKKLPLGEYGEDTDLADETHDLPRTDRKDL